MRNQDLEQRIIAGVKSVFKEVEMESWESTNKIVAWQENVKKARKKNEPYRVHTSERGFIRWHFGGDLLALRTDLSGDFTLEDGIYEIYDTEEDNFYLYFNPHEVQWKDLRFAVDGYGNIRDIINISISDRGADYMQEYKLGRGIDCALTLILCEEYEDE